MNSHVSYTLVSRSAADKVLRRWKNFTAEALAAAIFLADLAAIIAVSVITGIAYHTVAHGETGDVASFVWIGALAASMFVVPNAFRGEYRLSNFLTFRPHCRRTFQLWNVTFVCLLTLAFLAKVSVVYSRGWMLFFFLSGICLLLAMRYAVVQAILHASRAGLIATKRIFLVGTGRHIGEFINRYQPWRCGAHIVGCRFLTPVPKDAAAETRLRVLNQDLEAAIRSARQLEPNAIFIIGPWSETDTISQCVEALLSVPVEIHLGPERVLHAFNNVQLARLGPMPSLQLTRLPLSRVEILEKRLVDLVLAALGLVVLTPLLFLVAVLVKLESRGPVFFLQRRYGFNQEPFRIIKFRTMRTLDDGPVVEQAARDDPRITRIGGWLRRWNIDEIPQLFNVLKGDMSLVGPRPHALAHNHEYEQKIALYARRHNVKPGITGWAQIHGLRGRTDTEEKMRKRVEHDLYYIENWSLSLDLSILVRTVVSPSAYRNAG